ncbi:MAG: ArgE/DapE family deacylase [Actinomycetota bacterium]|nr:ArgE/DapE family deacylase [Actinomycetota bacterium]
MARELTDLISELVAIDSVNPDLVPGGAGEIELARFAVEWLERAGLEVSLDEIAPGRANAVAVARGTGGGRSLLLNGHLDTVGVSGMERPFEPYVADGRLYGRGAYDMKASLAAMMVTVARARELGLRGDLIVSAVADEEVASIGSEAVARAWHPDAVIVTEPTELAVAVAHRGFVWLDIETTGRAAHGSRPELGIDAIAKMGHVLVGLEELDRTLRATPTHRLLGSGSLHASLIEGGRELSTYPDRCLLQVERRTIPGETPDSVAAEVRAVVAHAAARDPELRVDVRVTFVREPFEVAEEEAIVQAITTAARTALASEPEPIGVPFWTDAGVFAAAGLPTVLFGPAGEGAHAAVEWVDLESVERLADALLAVAEDFCG